ncbi:hypothetical protein Nepgr_011174 [Nepenthes gracilis]|uniref:DUF7890 domain-containing protein n=1 Tax=Nepenthes gracilis TaxID=150966 RepID=A0AAD3SDQ7_NEPGR|nr:hypothetical protein Nepgr_011174 [Nepenthes gracilis]
MSNWWADCSSKIQIHKILETKMVDARSYKYGGELRNGKPSTRNKILKSTDQLGQPLLPHGEEGLKHVHWYDDRSRDEKKGVNIRVKVLMTKEEAAKLLSKCKDQKGTIELSDAVRELLTIPSNRVHVISAASNNHDMVLHSIPEEE